MYIKLQPDNLVAVSICMSVFKNIIRIYVVSSPFNWNLFRDKYLEHLKNMHFWNQSIADGGGGGWRKGLDKWLRR